MKKSFRGLGWLVLALVVGCSSGGGNGNGQTAGNTCEYAFDGECDEPDYCAYGTDTYDCGSGVGGSAGSAPTKKKPKGSGGSAGAAPTGNDCEYAYDGECDEPEYCAYGTDSYDCANAGGSGGMAGSSGVAGAAGSGGMAGTGSVGSGGVAGSAGSGGMAGSWPGSGGKAGSGGAAGAWPG